MMMVRTALHFDVTGDLTMYMCLEIAGHKPPDITPWFRGGYVRGVYVRQS